MFRPRTSQGSRQALRRAGVLVPAAALLTLAAGAATTMSAGALVTPALTFTPMTVSAVEGDAFHGQVISFTVDVGGAVVSAATEVAQVASPSITIDWGDGSAPSGGSLGYHSGHFLVSGEHLWTEEGTYTITVTIGGGGSDTAISIPSGSGQSTANVADAALHFDGHAPEAKGFTGQPITVSGQFRDDNPFGKASDLSATLTPGDGGADVAATVTYVSGGAVVHNPPIVYLVSGDAVYAHPGTYHATLTLTDKGGSTADHQVTVKVEQNPLVVVPTISGVEGAAFTGTLATFTLPHESGPDVNLQNYTFDYSIDWGDGSATTTASDFAGGDISGTHTYAEEGTFTYTVTVNATKQHSTTASSRVLTFFGTGTATVADAALSATGVDGTATAGAAFTKKVAHFTDADPASVLADFTTAPGGASINWGDGTAASAGTVVSASGGGYDVNGTHTYASAGTYTVTITVKDAGGATTTATATYTVTAAAGGVQGITTGGTISVPSTGGGPGRG